MIRYRTAGLTLLILIVLITAGGCRARKTLIADGGESRITEKALEQIFQHQLKYRTLEIKGSAKSNALGEKYNFSITYRNLADSLIWVSARAMLGIEAARLICTRDSVWVISRIAQIKEKGDWRTMSDLIGYPIDFAAFQGIFARSLFVPGRLETQLLNRYLTRKNENGQLMIPDYSDQEQKIILANSGFLPQFLIDSHTGVLQKTKIGPEDSSWLLEVLYGSESKGELMGLPSRVLIEANDMEESLEVELRIQAVSIDQVLKFPFSWF